MHEIHLQEMFNKTEHDQVMFHCDYEQIQFELFGIIYDTILYATGDSVTDIQHLTP